MSEAAVTLYKARAMIALSRKHKDDTAWWESKAAEIAASIIGA